MFKCACHRVYVYKCNRSDIERLYLGRCTAQRRQARRCAGAHAANATVRLL
jgi:hypothetical protein